MALLVPAGLAMHLNGRNEVLRVEIGLATLALSAPVAALYVCLAWRKARKLGMQS